MFLIGNDSAHVYFSRISALASFVVAVILFTGLTFGPTDARAQEVQVPLDRDSTLFVMNAELQGEIGVFADVDGFQEARLFRVSEDAYELVIQYREGGTTLRTRRTLTTEEVRDLRARISRRMEETDTVADLNQEGRYGLLGTTTYLGLAEGLLLTSALDAGEQGGGVLTLLGATGGFFVPLLATRDARVTEGEADMTFYGGTQGFLHAVEINEMAGGSGEGTAALAALLGAVEGTTGYLIARKRDWSGGHAEMTSLTGLSGNLAGLAVARGVSSDGSTLGLGAFVGSLVGAGIGHGLGRSDRYTQGDARVYALAGVQAANLTVSTLVAADVDSDDAGFAGAMAGAAGLAGGIALVRNRDFSKTGGNIVLLGSLAGSAAGGGFAAAVDANGSGAAVLQAAGSLTGYLITYNVYAGEARRRATTGTAGIDLDLDVTPSTASVPTHDGGHVSLSDEVVPKVTLTATF